MANEGLSQWFLSSNVSTVVCSYKNIYQYLSYPNARNVHKVHILIDVDVTCVADLC